MGDYRELPAWQRARASRRSTAPPNVPVRERYGLAAQMRRAAISVVSNIAEGASRSSDRELRRFLQIARGSLGELQSQITVARDLQLIAGEPAEALTQTAADTGRVIYGLLRAYSTRRSP